jgi:hypothetical protein
MSPGTSDVLFTTGNAQAPAQRGTGQRLILLGGWVFVIAALGYYAWRMAGIGLDLRQDLWVWSMPNHFGWGDLDNALSRGNAVLREAEAIAADDEQKKSPLERQREADQIAAGHWSPTLARPGPGLFDSPMSGQILVERWKRLGPVYHQILRGWVAYYEHLQSDVGDSGNYGLDYPPLRLLVMTLWSWQVQTEYPGLGRFPRTPRRIVDPDSHQSIVATADVAQPLLKLNAFCEGVSAVSILILVWLWMERSPTTTRSRMARWLSWPRPPPTIAIGDSSWRDRWGDPALLIPVIVFGILSLLRSNVGWEMWLPDTSEISPVDARITSIGWWVFLLLRFMSAVCLARFLPRPFRAPMCGLVAATMVWLNPASILDSFGFPQWDAWIPPFFLLAAVLATLDWWIGAGLLLGVGCMFKGQLLFVAPVLVLCPLLAGWPGRFVRILAGLAAGAGLVVWPWMVTNKRAEGWIVFAMSAAGLFCVASSVRELGRQKLAELARAGLQWWHKSAKQQSPVSGNAMLWVASLVLGAMLYLLLAVFLRRWTPHPAVLLGIGTAIVPWFLPRRMIGTWLLLVFASALWIAASQLGGSWSWWKIGFMFGTEKHQVMQLGSNSLSNLSSILGERYGWQLHDPVTTLRLPRLGATDLDLRDLLASTYFLTLILCAVAAAMHMRRNDPRFLAALAAPWALFPTLLTQMAARYPILPAVVGSCLIAVSAELSLLPFVQTVLACTMLGNQMMLVNHNTSPQAWSITQPTHPDIAWAVMLVAAIFLVTAVIPSRRRQPQIELL